MRTISKLYRDRDRRGWAVREPCGPDASTTKGPPVTATGGCLVLQNGWAPSGTMGRGRLIGRVRHHVRLRRRIPNQTIKSLRGSRKGLLGLSCNRRNKHTDDKAHDRKILHRNTPLSEVERSTTCEIWLTQRSVLCGIAAIAGIVRQYRCPSRAWTHERAAKFGLMRV